MGQGRQRATRQAIERRPRFRTLVKWRTGSEGRISAIKRSWGCRLCPRPPEALRASPVVGERSGEGLVLSGRLSRASILCATTNQPFAPSPGNSVSDSGLPHGASVTLTVHRDKDR